MKDILTFILVSVLIFAIVNGDDDNSLSSKFHNSLKATFPETIYSTPPPVDEDSSNSNNLPKLLLIGFEKDYINKGILFYVITRIIGYEPNSLTLTANVERSRTNLRFLEDLEFNCPLDKTEGNIYTFKCENSEYNASQLVVDLDSVKIGGQNLAHYSSAKFINKCYKTLATNPYLLVTDGENERNVGYTYKKIDAKDTLTLDNKVPINTNLHGQIGRINDNKSFILAFTDRTGNPNYNFTETEIFDKFRLEYEFNKKKLKLWPFHRSYSCYCNTLYCSTSRCCCLGFHIRK